MLDHSRHLLRYYFAEDVPHEEAEEVLAFAGGGISEGDQCCDLVEEAGGVELLNELLLHRQRREHVEPVELLVALIDYSAPLSLLPHPAEVRVEERTTEREIAR
jgi:hypothetical protein